LAVFLAMGPLLVAVEGTEVEPLEAVEELGQGRQGAAPSKLQGENAGKSAPDAAQRAADAETAAQVAASAKKKAAQKSLSMKIKADQKAHKKAVKEEKRKEKDARKKKEDRKIARRVGIPAPKKLSFAEKVSQEVKKEKKAAAKAEKPGVTKSSKKFEVDPGPTKPSIAKASLPTPVKKEDDVNAPLKTDSIKVLKAKADRKIKEIAKLEKIKDQLTKQIKGKGDKIGKAPKGDSITALPKKDSKKINAKLTAAMKKTEKKQEKKQEQNKAAAKKMKKMEKKMEKEKKVEKKAAVKKTEKKKGPARLGERNVEVKVDPEKAAKVSEFKDLMRQVP